MYVYNVENGYLSHQGDIQLICVKECGLVCIPCEGPEAPEAACCSIYMGVHCLT